MQLRDGHGAERGDRGASEARVVEDAVDDDGLAWLGLGLGSGLGSGLGLVLGLGLGLG